MVRGGALKIASILAAQAPEGEIPLHYWLWFALAVGLLLFLDLAVFHRKAHRVKAREAALTSAAWIALALGFNAFIYVRFGFQRALEFLTGYVIEEALSVDNLFVFVVIFQYFAVPREYQHRVLFWGILGAIIMRLAFILAGTELIHRFHWVIYVFGAFLAYTGLKLLFHAPAEMDPGKSWLLRLLRRFLPVADEYEGQRFLVRRNGKLVATRLLLVLLVVEATDVAFAVDSVPAILAVTQDRFIVFTSNIFAILGLRSIYFLLAGMMDSFRFLRFGLSAILMFVGVKMLVSKWSEIPIGLSLTVIVAVLAASVIASLVLPRRCAPEAPVGKGHPEAERRGLAGEP